MPRGESTPFTALHRAWDPLLRSHKTFSNRQPQMNLDGILAFLIWLKPTCAWARKRAAAKSHPSLSRFRFASFLRGGQVTLMPFPSRGEPDPKFQSGSFTTSPKNKPPNGTGPGQQNEMWVLATLDG